MSKEEKVLALEAAITAAEGEVPEHLTEALRQWIDCFIEIHPDLKYFGIFLRIQKRAVRKLARNEQLFGSRMR